MLEIKCYNGDNNKINLHKMECGGMEWIELAQDGEMW
jgi:hypothetical protein